METIPATEIKPNAYYTMTEAAKLLKTTKRGVESLLKKGRLRGIKLGKDWRFLGAALLALGASNGSDHFLFSALSAATFNRIWDNPEDAVYDDCVTLSANFLPPTSPP